MTTIRAISTLTSEYKKTEMPVCAITLEEVVNLKEPRMAKDGRIYEQKAILEHLTRYNRSPIIPSMTLNPQDVFKSPDLESLIECHNQLQKEHTALLDCRVESTKPFPSEHDEQLEKNSHKQIYAAEMRNHIISNHIKQIRATRVNAIALSWRIRTVAKKLKNAKSIADQATYSYLPKALHKAASYLPVISEMEQKYDKTAKEAESKYKEQINQTKLNGLSKTLLKGIICHKILTKKEESLRELCEIQAKEFESAAKNIRQSMTCFGKRKPLKDESKLSFLNFIKNDKSSIQDLTDKLYEAVTKRDKAKALVLYKQGAEINSLNSTSNLTPLFSAIKNLDVDMVRFLLGLGADSQTKLPKVSFTDRLRKETQLCEVGTTPLLFLAIHSQDLTPLFYANAEEIIKTLLDHKADIDASDCKSNTALHYAIRFGDPRFIEILIKYQANPMLLNCYGRTPLDELRLLAGKTLKSKFSVIQDLLIQATIQWQHKREKGAALLLQIKN